MTIIFEHPSPNFELSMEQNTQQHNSDLNSYDTGLNKAGLFARVSSSMLHTKLGLGGDFNTHSVR